MKGWLVLAALLAVGVIVLVVTVIEPMTAQLQQGLLP